MTNHKKGCFAVNFTVSTYSVSKKYRLSLREVLREMVLRETKKGLLLREVVREKKAISVRTSLRTCSLRTKTYFRCVLPCVPFLCVLKNLFCCVHYCVHYLCVLKKPVSVRSTVRSSVVESFSVVLLENLSKLYIQEAMRYSKYKKSVHKVKIILNMAKTKKSIL